MESPVKDVTFGEALKISLDHYYDLLKARAGDFDEKQFLQLQLASSIIDLSGESKKASEGGYHWNSKYNFLLACDKSISPVPVDGEIVTNINPFSKTYEEFLDQLTDYAVVRDLTPDEQVRLSALKLQIRDAKRRIGELRRLDNAEWELYAKLKGLSVGDQDSWYRWSKEEGYYTEIKDVKDEIRQARFKKKKLLDRQYGDLDDKGIADAAITLEDARLGYPIHADSLYPNGDSFNPTYLASSISESDALFDFRPVVTWGLTNDAILSTGGGGFEAEFNKETKDSKTIETDWSGGGSASYGLIRVRASASEHTKIQEDFSKATGIKLSAKAVFPVPVNFTPWLDTTLFYNKRLRENLSDFSEFFDKRGRLRYYPVKVVLLRGMRVEFTSKQDWSFDYSKKFSASAGGGFGVFGITFGASGSYSKNVEEHKVDKSGTKLTFTDGDNTLRFVGLVVQRNTVWDESVEQFVRGQGIV